MAKVYIQKTILDSSFKALPEGTKSEDLKGRIYIVKNTKYQKPTIGKAKVVGTAYAITDGEKVVTFDQQIANAIMASSTKNAENFFRKQVQNNPKSDKIKASKGRNYFLRNAMAITAVVLACVVGFLFFTMVSEKNFTNEVITVTAANYADIKPGDFIEIGLPILDLYGIEITETTTSYGIETNRSTYDGNQYALSFVFVENEEDIAPSFIFRYDPGTDVAAEIEKVKEEEYPFVELVRGEVRDLGAVEQLDSGQQIVPYFNSTIDEYYEGWAQPTWMLDGRVTQGDLNTVILVNGLGAMGTVAVAGAAVYFWQKSKKDMQEMVN